MKDLIHSCPTCKAEFATTDELLQHIADSQECRQPNIQIPIYEEPDSGDCPDSASRKVKIAKSKTRLIVAVAVALIIVSVGGYMLSTIKSAEYEVEIQAGNVVVDSRPKQETTISKEPVVQQECAKEDRVCAEAFKKYLDALASQNPAQAFSQTEAFFHITAKIRKNYPQSLWTVKVNEAVASALKNEDFQMPLSAWVSKKYTHVQHEIIEIRKNPKVELLECNIDMEDYEMVIAYYTIFYRLSYSGDRVPQFRGHSIKEVVCKSAVLWTLTGLLVVDAAGEILDCKSEAPCPIDAADLAAQIKAKEVKNAEKKKVLWVNSELYCSAKKRRSDADPVGDLTKDAKTLAALGFSIKQIHSENNVFAQARVTLSVTPPPELFSYATLKKESYVGIPMLQFLAVEIDEKSASEAIEPISLGKFEPSELPAIAQIRYKSTYVLPEIVAKTLEAARSLREKSKEYYLGKYNWFEFEKNIVAEEYDRVNCSFDVKQKRWICSEN